MLGWLYILLWTITPVIAGPRLISTSPQATETLFQLGKGADILATSQFSDYPEEAKKLPRVGPVFGIGVESILVLNPDWVITDPEASSAVLDRGLIASGIRHFPFKVNSLSALFEGSDKLLRRLYGEKQNQRLEKYRRCLNAFDPKSSYTFLAFAWLSPPVLFSRHTFLSDVISRTGGENLLGKEITINFPRISVEWLLRNRPEIMFSLSETPENESQARKLAAHWWPTNPPEVRALPAARFARGSFTPLISANEIQEGALPEECR